MDIEWTTRTGKQRPISDTEMDAVMVTPRIRSLDASGRYGPRLQFQRLFCAASFRASHL
jgi:hypothetical protein